MMCDTMKNFFLLLLLFVCVSANGQQNIIQINQSNGSTTTSTNQSECRFKINGICSSEDIGGVSLEMRRELRGGDYDVCQNWEVFADLTNYNNFTVTVLLQLEYETNYVSDEETYQIVLPSGGTKSIKLKRCRQSPYLLQGMIVRRLRN